MSINININYAPYISEVSLPVSLQEHSKLIFKPLSDEMSATVKDFPSFLKSSLAANLALIQVCTQFNMVSKRLIKDTDPLLISNMDNMTLGELDIEQDEIFYNI